MKLTKHAIGIGAVAALVLPMSASIHSSSVQAAACTSRVSLRASGWSGADNEGDLVQKGLRQFMKANPCITVFYSPIPGNFQQKIQTEFASSDEPDVFYVSPDMISNEGKAGKLLKLDSYLAKDGVKLSDYIPALLKNFQLNGATYGLPKDWGTLGIFYNKDIFAAKHIPVPSNNLTFDQFRALAKQVYTPSSNPSKVIYGTMVPSADIGRFMAILYGFGSDIMDPATGKILFNNANAVKAVDYWTGMQLVDHSAVQPSAIGDGWQGDSFGKGRVAMVLEGGWLTNYLRATYPKIHFSVAQMPIGSAGRADPVFTNAWGASARTANPAAAAKLIEFMSGPVYQDEQLRAGFALPTLTTLHDPVLKSDPDIANLYASYTVGRRGNFGAYDSQVNKVLGDALTAVLLGKQTPAQAIPAAAKTLQSQITAVP